jgi:hypothetical protein
MSLQMDMFPGNLTPATNESVTRVALLELAQAIQILSETQSLGRKGAIEFHVEKVRALLNEVSRGRQG